MRADLDRTEHSNYLVVAYSNGVSGSLRVIRVTASGAQLSSEPTSASLDGMSPKVELLDIDGDGRPEVIVSLATGRRGQRTSEVYRWAKDTLTAVAPGGFADPVFLDLEGDGHLALLEQSITCGDEPVECFPDGSYDVYKLSGAAFVKQPTRLAHVGEGLAEEVARHYPEALTAFARRYHLEEQRQQAFARIQSGQKRYIVAAYSNGHGGAVVLMESAKGGKYKVDQTVMPGFDGSDPEVTARDLDGDKTAEVIVSFFHDRGGDTAIDRIKGTTLETISPVTSSGGPVLVYPTFLDFAGKGMIDLVEISLEGPRNDPTARYDHYALRDGKYVALTPLDYYYVFYRQRRGTPPETVLFDVPASLIGKPLNLTILNGSDTMDERFRVNQASITLNGVKVAAEGFSKHRSSWTIPVTLTAQNALRVELCSNGDAD